MSLNLPLCRVNSFLQGITKYGSVDLSSSSVEFKLVVIEVASNV